MLLPWVSALPWQQQIYVQFERDILHIKVLSTGWINRRCIRQFSLPVSIKHALCTSEQCSSESWRHALKTLQTVLPEIATHSTQLYLVVGNTFVRYVTLPWEPNIATPQEKQAYLDYHFQSAYGETTKDWHTQIEPSVYGKSALVSAMPVALLEAFQSLSSKQITLASIVPAMLAGVAEHQTRSEDKWFIDTSRHTVTIGLWADRRLKFVHTHHRQEFLADPFRLYVRRESIRLGDPTLEDLPVIPLITQPTLDDALKQWDKTFTRFVHAKGTYDENARV